MPSLQPKVHPHLAQGGPRGPRPGPLTWKLRKCQQVSEAEVAEAGAGRGGVGEERGAHLSHGFHSCSGRSGLSGLLVGWEPIGLFLRPGAGWEPNSPVALNRPLRAAPPSPTVEELAQAPLCSGLWPGGGPGVDASLTLALPQCRE